jgi:hypothetical protein
MSFFGPEYRKSEAESNIVSIFVNRLSPSVPRTSRKEFPKTGFREAFRRPAGPGDSTTTPRNRTAREPGSRNSRSPKRSGFSSGVPGSPSETIPRTSREDPSPDPRPRLRRPLSPGSGIHGPGTPGPKRRNGTRPRSDPSRKNAASSQTFVRERSLRGRPPHPLNQPSALPPRRFRPALSRALPVRPKSPVPKPRSVTLPRKHRIFFV